MIADGTCMQHTLQLNVKNTGGWNCMYCTDFINRCRRLHCPQPDSRKANRA